MDGFGYKTTMKGQVLMMGCLCLLTGVIGLGREVGEGQVLA